MRSPKAIIVAAVLALGLVLAGTVGAQTSADDSLFLVDDGAPPSGPLLSVLLSQATNQDADAVRSVNLASAESFADALSSATLQLDGPLLLVPPTLPIPGEVLAELERLEPGLIRILGGPAAVSDDVRSALLDDGYAVERIWGPSRIDTAIQVAATAAPNADTAIIARAFGGADPTQAWADSVTAGAVAAQFGWPILLTNSEGLTPVTRDYLNASGIANVVIVGGPAAVSEQVRSTLLNMGLTVQRLGGQSRFETAVLMAQARGVPDGSRAIIVDGTDPDGWQAGLISARHAAANLASIILTAGDQIPEVSQNYLDQVAGETVTCLVPRSICGGAGVGDGGGSGGLGGAEPVVSYNPPPGSAMPPGEVINVHVDDPDRVTTGNVDIAPLDCQTTPIEYLPEGSASFSVVPTNIEEAGGDQGPPTGATPTQPVTEGQATGEPGPTPTTTAEPIEPNEPAPVNAPTACVINITVPLENGEELIDVATFYVVDLRPRIRIASYPQAVDEVIAFQDRSGGLIETWEWDFGDGGTSTLQHPDHTYTGPGCFEARLRVTSPLTHWFTGRYFTDSVTRTVTLDPLDPGTAHIDLQVWDGFRPAQGEVVELRDDSGIVETATTGADGRATFDDVPNNGASAPEEQVLFTVQGQTETLVQVPLAGYTVCPKLQIGDVGILAIDVVKAENQEEGISEADILITFEEFRFPGVPDDNGSFQLTEMPTETYTIVVESPGRATQTVQATVEADETVTVTIPMPLQ